MGKIVYPSCKWRSANGKILLTFDDGPVPDATPIALKQLERYNAKAVFFCIGANISRYPSLFAEIIRAGHTAGHHSMNHVKMTKVTKDDCTTELLQANEEFNKHGYSPRYFRPPFGRFNRRILRQVSDAGMRTVLWSLLTADYKNDITLVKRVVQKYLRKDSIIVLHDRVKNIDVISASLDIIFSEAAKRGFTIGGPEECLK